jgi:hypothetical protein
VEVAIRSIPINLRELEIRIGNSCTNVIFPAIAATLHRLEVLVIHFFDEGLGSDNLLPDDINRSSVQALLDGCPNLVDLEIVDGFVDIDTEATMLLAKFQHLRILKLFYHETIIEQLSKILTQSSSIKEITLLESEDDLYNESGGSEVWDEIEESLRQLSVRFPGITIGIIDCWWV